MEIPRTLRLRRESLVELDRSDLASLAAGNTFSCLDVISCNPINCVLSRAVCIDPH